MFVKSFGFFETLQSVNLTTAFSSAHSIADNLTAQVLSTDNTSLGLECRLELIPARRRRRIRCTSILCAPLGQKFVSTGRPHCGETYKNMSRLETYWKWMLRLLSPENHFRRSIFFRATILVISSPDTNYGLMISY